ncbi:2-amino-4-hydroxy-6-hydroxymethyldihydropteridine diphosphokinase [Haloferula sp.]|uniref:2-amino-4-hydroxy-6- hydroxymethyldihydropteridine diphosphokinase n=1 Tax=Haloferula sp. TaxID=2497595 RepID=UPI003C7404D4
MTERAAIALGSNLGDRLQNLRAARELLKKLSAPNGDLLQAPIYQTAPVACPEGSPDFYNTVLEISYAGTPHELLDATQAIEFHLGRLPGTERNAPRVVDLDILYLGEATETGGLLELPHPRLTSRRFVLQPLADIRPELILPGDGVTIAEHLSHLDTDEPPLALVQGAW